MTSPHQDADARRIVIIGNSGSGKSTLAKQLSTAHRLQHLDLDELAWRPTEPPERIPLDVAAEHLDRFTTVHPRWVIEGCYADLAALVLPLATDLIFLDIDVARCQHHARARPWEPHKYPSKEAQDENLAMLLDWIAAYPRREGPLGRQAHLDLFTRFDGSKEHRH